MPCRIRRGCCRGGNNHDFCRCRPYCGCGNRQIVFRKADSSTGAGIPGAVFELSSTGFRIASAVSDLGGCVRFPYLPQGSYVIKETYVNRRFNRSNTHYRLEVGLDGHTHINGIPSDEFCVLNHRARMPVNNIFITLTDENGVPLSGGYFDLYYGSKKIRSVVSNANGTIKFFQLPQGGYRLVEAEPPAGYTEALRHYAVNIMPDGNVLINGVPSSYGIYNYTSPALLLDAVTRDGKPLPQAVFILSQGNIVIKEFSSDVYGIAAASALQAGVYTVRAVSAPDGHESQFEATVVVGVDGSVTVDGKEGVIVVVFD